MKIEGKASGGTGDKRFYIPGVVLKDNCPKCKKEVELDMAVRYLSYPSIGGKEKVHFYCCEDDGGCAEEWTKHVILELSVREAI